MDSATLLRTDDACRRRAFYAQRWMPTALRPKEILTRSIAHGLMAGGDAGEAAEAESLRLATEIGIDTEQTDLLSLAEHIAGLAIFVAWLLRGIQPPYKRPEAVSLPDGQQWFSGAFLSQDERSLRSVRLVDRWDAWTQTALEHSWQVAGECAAYGVPMSLVVVEIGQLRNGRWSNPFTTAYRHPVSKTLRFRKRDGHDFGSTWEKVLRETDNATREEWLDAMADDGVLAESLHIHRIEPERVQERAALAVAKLIRIQETRTFPEPQLSQCFQRVSPCPFRSCCPRGEEPSEALGFLRPPAIVLGCELGLYESAKDTERSHL